MSNPIIVAEIQRRMAVLVSKMEVTQERVLAEMCKIAFSSLDELATWGKDGLTLKESTGLDPSALAAVRTIVEKHTKYGQSLAISLHDKVKCLQVLGNWLGLANQDSSRLGPRVATGVPHNPQELSASEELPDRS